MQKTVQAVKAWVGVSLAALALAAVCVQAHAQTQPQKQTRAQKEQMRRLQKAERTRQADMSEVELSEEGTLTPEQQAQEDAAIRRIMENARKGIGLPEFATQERINVFVAQDRMDLFKPRVEKAARAFAHSSVGKVFLSGFGGNKYSQEELVKQLQGRGLYGALCDQTKEGLLCESLEGSEITRDRMTIAQCLDHARRGSVIKEMHIKEDEKRLRIVLYALPEGESKRARGHFAVWDDYRARCYYFPLSTIDAARVEAVARTVTW